MLDKVHKAIQIFDDLEEEEIENCIEWLEDMLSRMRTVQAIKALTKKRPRLLPTIEEEIFGKKERIVNRTVRFRTPYKEHLNEILDTEIGVTLDEIHSRIKGNKNGIHEHLKRYEGQLYDQHEGLWYKRNGAKS